MEIFDATFAAFAVLGARLLDAQAYQADVLERGQIFVCRGVQLLAKLVD